MTKPITPLLTVDALICVEDEILLIERRFEPTGWALPGGFVDIGETVEQALIREVKEEVSLVVTQHTFFGVYSNPERDPRGHTVSLVYCVTCQGEAQAQDDAQACAWYPIQALPSQMAFDHRQIILDYSHHKKN